MRILTAQQKLDKERGVILDRMKLLVRHSEVAGGIGAPLTASEEKEWARLAYAFKSGEPPAESTEQKKAFIEKWDTYLSEIVNPVQSRIAGQLAAQAEGRDYEGREGRLYQDSEGNVIKPLLAGESFEDWGRAHGLVPTDGTPSLNMGQFLKKIVAGSPSDTQGIGVPSLGGYLLPTPLSLRLLDMALNATRVRQAGAVTIPMSSSTLRIVKQLSMPTANWKAENAPIEGSEEITFGPIDLQARTLVAMVTASIELIEDAAVGGQFGSVVEGYLSRAFGLELDRVCLFGSGSGQEPRGIWSNPLIQHLDAAGSLDDYDALSQAVQKLREVNIEPGDFILSPRTAGDLDRLKDSLGRPLQPPPSVAERKLLTSNQVKNTLPTSFSGSPDVDTGSGSTGSAIFLADWPSLLIGMRTPIVVEVSRLAPQAWDNLQFQIRAYMRMDVALTFEDRFAVIRGITAATEGSPA